MKNDCLNSHNNSQLCSEPTVLLQNYRPTSMVGIIYYILTKIVQSLVGCEFLISSFNHPKYQLLLFSVLFEILGTCA